MNTDFIPSPRPARGGLGALALALALPACGLLGPKALAGDWLNFRGPGSVGLASGTPLPTTLEGEKNIAWKTALPGRGISSPVIVGDKVFVTASSGPEQNRLHVICLSAADGKKLWERQFWATGRTMCHEKICVASPTPASDGQRIFALFSSNDLFCLDLEGNLIWLRGMMLDYPNASNSLGMAASPVVVGGVLVAQLETEGDAFAVGIDAATGVNRWKIARPKRANWTSPLTMAGPDGRTMVILQGSGGVQAVDPESGATIWNYAEGASTTASGAISGETLYIPSFGVTALKTSNQGQNFEQAWRASPLRPGTASPVADDGKLYILNDGGVLTAGDLSDGKRLWQTRLKGPFSASPLLAGGHLYAANEKGLVQVVDPSGEEGRVVGELDLGEMFIATPSIGAGGLYLRGDGHIWKLRAL